jgi:uncharacterized protein involved in type VI secretion and phage assembly
MPAQNYFGLYGATVVNNIDPMHLGRISVSVPAISSAPSAWASPCFPVAGNQVGIFAVPPIGAHVWVQFEAGDIHRPVWMGGHYANASELPVQAGPSDIVLQASGNQAIVISAQNSGEIVIRNGAASIVLNAAGITIQNGTGASIVLSGPSVSINQDALAVT